MRRLHRRQVRRLFRRTRFEQTDVAGEVAWPVGKLRYRVRWHPDASALCDLETCVSVDGNLVTLEHPLAEVKAQGHKPVAGLSWSLSPSEQAAWPAICDRIEADVARLILEPPTDGL